MGKTKRRPAEADRNPRPAADATAERGPALAPLPPPRRNKALLGLAIAFVILWILALIYLVVRA